MALERRVRDQWLTWSVRRKLARAVECLNLKMSEMGRLGSLEAERNGLRLTGGPDKLKDV